MRQRHIIGVIVCVIVLAAAIYERGAVYRIEAPLVRASKEPIKMAPPECCMWELNPAMPLS